MHIHIAISKYAAQHTLFLRLFHRKLQAAPGSKHSLWETNPHQLWEFYWNWNTCMVKYRMMLDMFQNCRTIRIKWTCVLAHAWVTHEQDKNKLHCLGAFKSNHLPFGEKINLCRGNLHLTVMVHLTRNCCSHLNRSWRVPKQRRCHLL